MDKLTGSDKVKEINIGLKRYRKKLKRKKIYYGIIRNKNSRNEKISREEIKIKAPSNFSFLENTENIINYFNIAENELKNGNNVYFDLKEVDNLGFEAITLLMAKIADKNFNKDYLCSGNEPDNELAKEIFIQSGFLDLVKSTRKNIPSNNGNIIQHISTSKVNTSYSVNVYKEVINHTFGGVRYMNLHPILIECMGNTDNHAGFGTDIEYKWWLSYYKVPGTKITQICFIDLGVGICSSMNSRWEKIWDKLCISTNLNKFKELIDENSEFNLSRTTQTERGKGLRSMNNVSKNEEVKKFTIISNSIYANLSENKIEKMGTSFKGTFIYWELHPLIK